MGAYISTPTSTIRIRQGVSAMLMAPRTAIRLPRFLSPPPSRHSKIELSLSSRLCYRPSRRVMSSLSKTEPFPVGAVLQGRSGRKYDIQEILSDRRDVQLFVYRASAGEENFVIKNLPPGVFEYQQDLQSQLASCPNLRTAIDTVPDCNLLVYRFLAGDLLQTSQKTIAKATRKSILKSALSGLVDLHEKGILHGDIKPNNILLDYEDAAGDDITVHSVQVSDLEDAVMIPPGKDLTDLLSGNQLWRSPESWARARQNTPSDVFSFGVVTIYVMFNIMIFRVSDKQLNGEDAWWHILRRHLSHFGDRDGFNGLLEHLGMENPFFQRLIDLTDDFTVPDSDAHRRRPFAMWPQADVELRDLILKMMSLDPARRITAREALEHPWFQKAE